MKNKLQLMGSLAGGAGIAVCIVAGITRVAGSFYLLGFETMSVFVGGMALMLVGCLAKLEALS